MSIGPVTTATLREHGLEPHVEAGATTSTACSRRCWRTRRSSQHSDNAVLTFLSDYGLGNEFVGVCHAVIARRCPDARVIDLTHAIPRHDVRTAALVLRATLPYLPDAIILAVVDPGVGTTARAAAAPSPCAPSRRGACWSAPTTAC